MSYTPNKVSNSDTIRTFVSKTNALMDSVVEVESNIEEKFVKNNTSLEEIQMMLSMGGMI